MDARKRSRAPSRLTNRMTYITFTECILRSWLKKKNASHAKLRIPKVAVLSNVNAFTRLRVFVRNATIDREGSGVSIRFDSRSRFPELTLVRLRSGSYSRARARARVILSKSSFSERPRFRVSFSQSSKSKVQVGAKKEIISSSLFATLR